MSHDGSDISIGIIECQKKQKKKHALILIWKKKEENEKLY